MSMEFTTTTIGLVVSILATGIGAAIAEWSKKLSARVRPKLHWGGPLYCDSEDISEGINSEFTVRLQDARWAKSRQERIAIWNKRANAFLTLAQYVVGGVLATSFVQQSLSKEAVGLLGVIVLVSKLIHQHYRPDLVFAGASQRAVFLSHTIRSVEDDLFALSNGMVLPETKSIDIIRRRVSKALSQIEQAELTEINSRMESPDQSVQANIDDSAT